jgi:hypothetical protein
VGKGTLQENLYPIIHNRKEGEDMTIISRMSTTAQAELSELLNRGVTITMIAERTGLTQKILLAVANGIEEAGWIFEKLFSLNMLMDVADENEKTPDAMLEQLIHEKMEGEGHVSRLHHFL